MPASLSIGDRNKAVKFRFSTKGIIDGTAVDSARFFVKRPRASSSVEWPVSIVPGETTAALVVLSHTLASDGSDVPAGSEGDYRVRVWALQGGVVIAESKPGAKFTVSKPQIGYMGE